MKGPHSVSWKMNVKAEGLAEPIQANLFGLTSTSGSKCCA